MESKSRLVNKILIMLLLLIVPLPLLLAQRSVSGTVTAADDGAVLPGVNVIVKGTTRGVITDVDGTYVIDVQEGDETLVFSYIGFENQEIPINDRIVIDIILNTESTALDEIVVIGYGTVRKSDLTGSVSTLQSEDITRVNDVNPVQNLQGKVSGVRISSTSGAPGAAPSVRIRGVGTFGNSDPIYVVDGVILDNISFLNSADIESWQVLKDASATAIYGSRGANGVIIITTKLGKGTTASYSFSGEFGMQLLEKKIDLLTGREFAIISNEISPGSYNNIDAVPNTDWQDLIFRSAPVHNHQFSLSGSTDNTQYYLGVGYYNQEGIIDKSNYERLSLKLNNSYKLSDGITLGNNFTIAPYKQQNAPDVVFAVYRAQPLLIPKNEDGSYAEVHNVGNPLASLEYSNSFNRGIRGVGNVFAEIDFLKDFSLRSSIGIDAAYNKSESFTPAFFVSSQQENVLSDLSKSNNENMSWLWENTLSFYKEVGRSVFDAVAGFTMQETTSERFSINGENLIRNGEDFWYLNPSYIFDENNNVNTIQSIENDVDINLNYSMISYLARANYTFDRKYILTATFRRDGSSKFSDKNRFSNFPSFAAGWNLGREEFMADMDFISSLKIRGSWGKTGNEKIEYNSRYARVDADILAVFGIDEATNAAASYGNSGNPDLVWETTTQTDVGLEIGFFDNRLTGEFDYYNKVTDDILIDLSTPGHLGNGQGTKIAFNAASVLNRGFEFNVNWRERRGDFNYSLGVLGSTLYNEVLDIGGSSGVDSVLLGGELANGARVTQSMEGLPIGAFYGYKTNGIFQDLTELNAYPHDSRAGVGDLRFVDVNEDGMISGLDRTYIGSPIPDFIYGINMSMGYLGFDLSVDFQGQIGNEIFNGKEVVRPDPYNFEARVMDRWTGPGTSTTVPRPSFGGYNYTPSDYFIQDGSFFRLRNVMLGYTLPSALSESLKIQNMRVYIKGTNIFTLTDFTGYSPEISSSDDLANGIDKGIYPVTTIYSVGLNLTF